MNPTTDHPRIRGEHTVIGWAWDGVKGSSPHTRGARDGCDAELEDERIIPAYAGSTRKAWSASSAPLDHPRIRGEHSTVMNASSPTARIIPAYAGSTPIL